MKKHYNKGLKVFLLLVAMSVSSTCFTPVTYAAKDTKVTRETKEADSKDTEETKAKSETAADQKSDKDSKKSESTVYHNLKTRSKGEFYQGLNDVNNNKNQDGTVMWSDTFWGEYFYYYENFKSISPLILFGSIIFGVLVAAFARKNKGLKKWAIGTMCIVIPVLVLIAVFALPYAYSIFG